MGSDRLQPTAAPPHPTLCPTPSHRVQEASAAQHPTPNPPHTHPHTHLLSAQHEGTPWLQWLCLLTDCLCHEQAVPVDLGEAVKLNRPGHSKVVPGATPLNILGRVLTATARGQGGDRERGAGRERTRQGGQAQQRQAGSGERRGKAGRGGSQCRQQGHRLLGCRYAAAAAASSQPRRPTWPLQASSTTQAGRLPSGTSSCCCCCC